MIKEKIQEVVVISILSIAIVGTAVALLCLSPLWLLAEEERKRKIEYAKWKDRFKLWNKEK